MPLTGKPYDVIFVIPVTTSTSLPMKKKGYLTAFKWKSYKPSTNRQIIHGLLNGTVCSSRLFSNE